MAIAEGTSTLATVLRFPKRKKPGPKVKRGAPAQVLSFPHQLTGDALRSRWAWLQRNHGNWEVDTPDAAMGDYDDDPRSWQIAVAVQEGVVLALGREFSEARMRRDIAEWREVVAQRARLKRWLAGLGVECSNVQGPQEALALVFARMSPLPAA